MTRRPGTPHKLSLDGQRKQREEIRRKLAKSGHKREAIEKILSGFRTIQDDPTLCDDCNCRPCICLPFPCPCGGTLEIMDYREPPVHSEPACEEFTARGEAYAGEVIKKFVEQPNA